MRPAALKLVELVARAAARKALNDALPRPETGTHEPELADFEPFGNAVYLLRSMLYAIDSY